MASAGSSASGGSSALLMLRPESVLVMEHLTRLLTAALGERVEGVPCAVDTRVGDFDGCYWRIEVEEEKPTIVRVCLDVPNFADLKALGVDAHLSARYGRLLVPARPDASVSLVLDARALPGPLADVVLDVASLRRHVLAFPFVRAMAAVAAGRGGSEAPFVLRTRPREPVYTLTRADRVVVIYHLEFPDPTDRALARIVAQELTEAYRAVNHAPPCAWSEREPPAELRGFPGGLAPMGDSSCIGYLTFSLFPTSFKTDAHREAAAAQLALLRAYLGYHLKASKTYLHARMRTRAEGLQRVLNRAILEDPTATKEGAASGAGGAAGAKR